MYKTKRATVHSLSIVAIAATSIGLTTLVPARAQETKKNLDAPPMVTALTQEDARPSAVTLTGGVRTRDWGQEARRKLAAGVELTSDEYRSLEIGVLGMETVRTFYTHEAVITILNDGCPAKEAGMKVGDVRIATSTAKLQEESKEDARVEDPTRASYSFGVGHAGDTVDITVRRKNRIIDFHLVRMNMEDIPDPVVRRTFENLIKTLGFKDGGSQDIPKALLDRAQDDAEAGDSGN